MKQAVMFCIFLNQALSVMVWPPSELQEQQREVKHPPASCKQSNHKWSAATYRGLTMGKSTRAEVLRIFGTPERIDTPADQAEGELKPEEWYVYKSGGEFLGDLIVIIDKNKGIVCRIDLYPNDLSKGEAIKHFGNDYITMRYDFDLCLGNEEAAPVYESPNGPIVNIEYRVRGIAIGISGAGKVDQINYVSKPIGAVSSKCNQSDKL